MARDGREEHTTVRVETADLDEHADALRVSGQVGGDSAAAMHQHAGIRAILVEPGRPYELTKDRWDAAALELLLRASTQDSAPAVETQLDDGAAGAGLRKRPQAAKEIDAARMPTGGAYIPPAKLRAMQAQIADKSSVAYQRISWEALRKSLNGIVNKVNVANIKAVVLEVFSENLVRGRGLFARSCLRAQAASPAFTAVYAALVAVVNTKLPQSGELILKRLIIQFRRAYRRDDKALCMSTTRFIAHLVNQQVAYEVLALQILTFLLHKPTDDSVEVAVAFLKECGHVSAACVCPCPIRRRH